MHYEEAMACAQGKNILIKIAPVIVALSIVEETIAADHYLCVAEKATGFSYDNAAREWKNTHFKITSKYIVSKPEGTEYAYQVTQVGEKYPISNCKSGFNGYGYLFCSGLGIDFTFNRKNGRYLSISPVGYINVLPELKITDENSDTPFIEIGKCSPY